MHIFQYDPLNHNTASIRLVEVLHKRSKSGLVQCRMLNGTIASNRYTCLSYEWDSKPGGEWIIINGELHYVRRNLWDFLRVATSKYCKQKLWIDALCIDQTNIDERSHQVQMMVTIYKEASEVWVWLGDDPTAARLLTGNPVAKEGTISKSKHGNAPPGLAVSGESIKGQQTQKDIDRMAYVSQNSYWTRAWITQEVALARRIRLLAEDQRVKESELPSMAISPLYQTRQLRSSREYLTTLLHRFANKKSTIPQDAVFSLLGLCEDGAEIDTNYSLSSQEVFEQVLSACRRTMCLCSPGILSKALRMRGTVHGNVEIRNVKLNRLVFNPHIYDRDSEMRIWRCAQCNVSSHRGAAHDGYYVCVGSGCCLEPFHYFWNWNHEYSRYSTMMQDFPYRGTRSKYPARLQEARVLPSPTMGFDDDRTLYTLQMPVSVLLDLKYSEDLDPSHMENFMATRLDARFHSAGT
ncbi:heterokaryon incompatibility protein-domain-containing protein [Paraphoma chrysanthemicola]|nr:heterokaryon incompatibility protein-domain-containing protein [Paraphoma chrysanthemicola]